MFSGSCLQTATHSHRMRTEWSPSLRSSESMTPPSNGPVSGEIRLAGPRPLSAVTQLFKSWQRAEACQFNFGQLGHPEQQWIRKMKHERERRKNKNQVVLCCSCIFNIRHEHCASIFLPSLRSVWFLICQTEENSKKNCLSSLLRHSFGYECYSQKCGVDEGGDKGVEKRLW